MATIKTIFMPGATLQFQEVVSMTGLSTGYQIFRKAETLDDFIKRIPWKHYYAYGLELRYVLRTEVEPETFTFTAHLFHKQDKHEKNKTVKKFRRTKFRRTKF